MPADADSNYGVFWCLLFASVLSFAAVSARLALRSAAGSAPPLRQHSGEHFTPPCPQTASPCFALQMLFGERLVHLWPGLRRCLWRLGARSRKSAKGLPKRHCEVTAKCWYCVGSGCRRLSLSPLASPKPSWYMCESHNSTSRYQLTGFATHWDGGAGPTAYGTASEGGRRRASSSNVGYRDASARTVLCLLWGQA